MNILMNLNYPGNVRQLENIIEHVFALSNENIIKPHHLPDEIYKGKSASGNIKLDSLGNIEKQFILNMLENNNWNRSKTAKEMGIHKTTLYRKMQKLGIKPSSANNPTNINK